MNDIYYFTVLAFGTAGFAFVAGYFYASAKIYNYIKENIADGILEFNYSKRRKSDKKN